MPLAFKGGVDENRDFFNQNSEKTRLIEKNLIIQVKRKGFEKYSRGYEKKFCLEKMVVNLSQSGPQIGILAIFSNFHHFSPATFGKEVHEISVNTRFKWSRCIFQRLF